jgi:hypothetical protein
MFRLVNARCRFVKAATAERKKKERRKGRASIECSEEHVKNSSARFCRGGGENTSSSRSKKQLAQRHWPMVFSAFTKTAKRDAEACFLAHTYQIQVRMLMLRKKKTSKTKYRQSSRHHLSVLHPKMIRDLCGILSVHCRGFLFLLLLLKECHLWQQVNG